MQGIVGASLSKHHMYVLACAKVGKFEDGCMFMMNKKSFWSEATRMNMVAFKVCNLPNIRTA